MTVFCVQEVTPLIGYYQDIDILRRNTLTHSRRPILLLLPVRQSESHSALGLVTDVIGEYQMITVVS